VQVRLSQAMKGIMAALASEVMGRGLTLPTQVRCTVSGEHYGTRVHRLSFRSSVHTQPDSYSLRSPS